MALEASKITPLCGNIKAVSRPSSMITAIYGIESALVIKSHLSAPISAFSSLSHLHHLKCTPIFIYFSLGYVSRYLLVRSHRFALIIPLLYQYVYLYFSAHFDSQRSLAKILNSLPGKLISRVFVLRSTRLVQIQTNTAMAWSNLNDRSLLGRFSY